MARRRARITTAPSAAPAVLRSLRFADWPGPLLCDENGHCRNNGNGPHDDTCWMFSARRRYYDARREARKGHTS